MIERKHTRADPDHESGADALERERHELLQRLEDWLDTPMLILAFVWLGLLGVELVWGSSRVFEIAGSIIWAVFILNFALEFLIAPRKLAYLKRNWLIALSLLIPPLRIFRAVRALQVARAGQGVRLLRVFGSLNRGMEALGTSLKRRGFGYVVALTALVTFTGAAGMYAFENRPPGTLASYWDALWWTAMIMTTMGSQDWPHTVEGRILCVFLALYAFAVFGYTTATLATFFIGRDAAAEKKHADAAEKPDDLRREISALRAELRALRVGAGPSRPGVDVLADE